MSFIDYEKDKLIAESRKASIFEVVSLEGSLEGKHLAMKLPLGCEPRSNKLPNGVYDEQIPEEIKQLEGEIKRILAVQEMIKGDRDAERSVLKLLDYDFSPFPWYVMELGTGSLKDAMAGGKLINIEDFKQMLESLGYIHRAGIIHRDIKPENIIHSGGLWTFIDFEFASIARQPSKSHELKGTTYYMAPEQWDPNHVEFTPVTDVWAMGIIMCEAVLGFDPFPRNLTDDNMKRRVCESGPDLKKIPSHYSDYEGVLSQVLQVNPQTRTKDMDAFLKLLADPKRAEVKDQNLLTSSFETGMKFYKGLGGRPDFEEAYRFFDLDKGKAESWAMKQIMTIRGEGVKRRPSVLELSQITVPSKKKELDTKARTNPDIDWIIGQAFELLYGSEKREDYRDEAFEHYKRSSKNGSPLGQYGFYMFASQGGREDERDYAIFGLKRSANQGYWPACCELSRLIDRDDPDYEPLCDKFKEQGWEELLELFTTSPGPASPLPAPTVPVSAPNNGSDGSTNGTQSSDVEGSGSSGDDDITSLERRAENGDPDAQFRLGKCYENGSGVSKDPEKAVHWYTKAADQGHADAQYNLGLCYHNGIGVSKNPEKAVHWYTKAADQGHADAQYKLGLCYEKGTGVPQDFLKAMGWYTKADKNGNKSAKSRLEALHGGEIGGNNNSTSYQKKKKKKGLWSRIIVHRRRMISIRSYYWS